MSNCVLIDIMNSNNFDAGTKARNDVTKILTNMNFVSTVLFNRNHNNFIRSLEIVYAMYQLGKKIEKNDIIVLQYPYNPKIMKLILKCIKKLKRSQSCKLIILIHDIVYLRNEPGLNINLEEMKKLEINLFNNADSLIVHNQIMQNELKNSGVTVPMYNLQIFDYLYNGKTATITNTGNNEIVFAGNLSPDKSGFIYECNCGKKIRFNLYGKNQSQLSILHNYKGCFSPDELIGKLEGNYGLVWDGPSANKCEGNYGNYLRYNNPHKFSLYIAAGLPTIVWEFSALADFVKKNQVGIVISSLEDLANITKPNTDEYNKMLFNVNLLRKKVSSGFMLASLIKELQLTL